MRFSGKLENMKFQDKGKYLYGGIVILFILLTFIFVKTDCTKVCNNLEGDAVPSQCVDCCSSCKLGCSYMFFLYGGYANCIKDCVLDDCCD